MGLTPTPGFEPLDWKHHHRTAAVPQPEFPMNLPNYLSLARILMVPILVVVLLTRVTNHEIIGVLVFWVASLTDLLDGYLARRLEAGDHPGQTAGPAGRQAARHGRPDFPGGAGPGAGLDDLHHPRPGDGDHRSARHRQRGGHHHLGRTSGQVEAGRPDRGHLLPDPRTQAGRLALRMDPPRHLPLLHPAAQAVQLLLGHGHAPALAGHDPVGVERRLLHPHLLEAGWAPASSPPRAASPAPGSGPETRNDQDPGNPRPGRGRIHGPPVPPGEGSSPCCRPR